MINVLYAEDDPQVAEIVSLSFGLDPDTELTVVSSGRACLAALERGRYDILLLDLMMPDLTGLQVLGELASRRDPTPVIMVSGQGQYELAVRALRAGAVDCIDKNSPDFRRIHEITKQTLARQCRRVELAPVTGKPRTHRVLYLDPQSAERASTARFFATNAPLLALTVEAPPALDAFLLGVTAFDAVVLGPNIDATEMLNALRHLRAKEPAVPVIALTTHNSGEVAVAAFKLGAHDFLVQGTGRDTELVFSLNNALNRADTERRNARLTEELATLNRSLAEQVAARTRDLQAEVGVRRDAEQSAAEQAARSQALATQLLRVQEAERRSIAQELHDQVGQLLTGLRLQLEAVQSRHPESDLGEALVITDDLLQGIRALTLQLRPRILDDLGLEPALNWQAKLFQRQTGIAVELEVSLPPARLPADLETGVFRLVQEALTNVARHSQAKTAVVTVTADDVTLHVEVADRGCGFDATTALARRDSLGLAGLAERVKLAGGHFEIFSQSGKGTRLHAEFGLTPGQPAAP